MADLSIILEGSMRYREAKRWKPRWCIIRKLSPVADRLHIALYRSAREHYLRERPKAQLSLEHFCGILSGFTVDHEDHVMAIVCLKQVILLAFHNPQTRDAWQIAVRNHLGEECQHALTLVKSPSATRFPLGPCRLLIQGPRICLTADCPPYIIVSWKLPDIRRFGIIDKKLCIEACSRCGKAAGIFVFNSDQAATIVSQLNDISHGKQPRGRQEPARRRVFHGSNEAGIGISSSALSVHRSGSLRTFTRNQFYGDHSFSSSGQNVPRSPSVIEYASITFDNPSQSNSDASLAESHVQLQVENQGAHYCVSSESRIPENSELSASDYQTRCSTVPRKFGYGDLKLVSRDRSSSSVKSSQPVKQRTNSCDSGPTPKEPVWRQASSNHSDNSHMSKTDNQLQRKHAPKQLWKSASHLPTSHESYVSSLQHNIDTLSPKLDRCSTPPSSAVSTVECHTLPKQGRSACKLASHGRLSQGTGSGVDLTNAQLQEYSMDGTGVRTSVKSSSSNSSSSTYDLTAKTPTLSCSVGSVSANSQLSQASAAGQASCDCNKRLPCNENKCCDYCLSHEPLVSKVDNYSPTGHRAKFLDSTSTNRLYTKFPAFGDSASPHTPMPASSNPTVQKRHLNQPLNYIDLNQFDDSSTEHSYFVKGADLIQPASATTETIAQSSMGTHPAGKNVQHPSTTNTARMERKKPPEVPPRDKKSKQSLNKRFFSLRNKTEVTSASYQNLPESSGGELLRGVPPAPPADLMSRTPVSRKQVEDLHRNLKRNSVRQDETISRPNLVPLNHNSPSEGGAYVTLRDHDTYEIMPLNRGRSMDDVLGGNRGFSLHRTLSDVGRSGIPAPNVSAPSVPGRTGTSSGGTVTSYPPSCMAVEPVYATPIMTSAGSSVSRQLSRTQTSPANLERYKQDSRAEYLLMSHGYSMAATTAEEESAIFCAVDLPKKRGSRLGSFSGPARERCDTAASFTYGSHDTGTMYVHMGSVKTDRPITIDRSVSMKADMLNLRPRLHHSRSLDNELDGSTGYLEMETKKTSTQMAGSSDPNYLQMKSGRRPKHRQSLSSTSKSDLFSGPLVIKPFEGLIESRHYREKGKQGTVICTGNDILRSDSEKGIDKSGSDDDCSSGSSTKSLGEKSSKPQSLLSRLMRRNSKDAKSSKKKEKEKPEETASIRGLISDRIPEIIGEVGVQGTSVDDVCFCGQNNCPKPGNTHSGSKKHLNNSSDYLLENNVPSNIRRSSSTPQKGMPPAVHIGVVPVVPPAVHIGVVPVVPPRTYRAPPGPAGRGGPVYMEMNLEQSDKSLNVHQQQPPTTPTVPSYYNVMEEVYPCSTSKVEIIDMAPPVPQKTYKGKHAGSSPQTNTPPHTMFSSLPTEAKDSLSTSNLSLDNLDDDVFEPSDSLRTPPGELRRTSTPSSEYRKKHPNLTVCIPKDSPETPTTAAAAAGYGGVCGDLPRSPISPGVNRFPLHQQLPIHGSSSDDADSANTDDHDVSSPAITTMRPRAGNEYKRIDRRKLAEDLNITVCDRHSISPQSPSKTSSIFTFNVAGSSTLSRCNSSASGRSSDTELQRHASMSSGRGPRAPDPAAYVNICFTRTNSPAIIEGTPPPGSPGAVSNISHASDALLNYAEMDLSQQENGVADGSKPSHRLPLKKGSGVEYALIDMVATSAASRVGREHAQLREDSLWRKGRRSDKEHTHPHHRSSFRSRQGQSGSSSKSHSRPSSAGPAKDKRT